jgi:hypothetical protein
MRRLVPLLALLVLASSPVAGHADQSWPPGNHSGHVADFFWEPRSPERGQDMRATLTLKDPPELDAVILRVCRVQGYACRAPIELKALSPDDARPQYTADLPWDGRFYRHVTEVGIAVVLDFPNGTTEESPAAPWPGPVDLPEGAGTYYFFDLPPEPAGASGPSLWLVALVVLALAAGRKR